MKSNGLSGSRLLSYGIQDINDLGKRSPRLLACQPWDGDGDCDRLWSPDLFRGVVMFFLIAEVTGQYGLLAAAGNSATVIQAVRRQFQHHPWHGIRLWDFG